LILYGWSENWIQYPAAFNEGCCDGVPALFDGIDRGARGEADDTSSSPTDCPD
jgi:hypothetical protein